MAGKYRGIYYAINKYLVSWLPDRLYHNLWGAIIHRRHKMPYHWMNISAPRTLNEKLQWLKSHGDVALKTRLADKIEVREYVSERIGDKYLIERVPLNKRGDMWVTSANDIDFDVLPERFALKLTKGSGYNLLCEDKSLLDLDEVRAKVDYWLGLDIFYMSREPQYRGVSRVVCEKMLEYNITDYKFFCFNGEPKFVELHIDRFGKHFKSYYDTEWRKTPFPSCHPSDHESERPAAYDEMLEVARRLSRGLDFVRVDLYEYGGKVYFGELTFHPGGGYEPITDHEWDCRLGDMLHIEQLKS